MEQEIKVEPSEELAYWIGVAQSDGSFYKRNGCDSWRIDIEVSDRSLPMLDKFKQISEKFFGIDRKIVRSHDGYYRYMFTATKFIESFRILDIEFHDPPKPCAWFETLNLFGAYLAGVIDGDGDIMIKRPEYPQCAIRIASGSPQMQLRDAIKAKLKCGVHITKKFSEQYSKQEKRVISGTGYILGFLISPKTIDFVKEFLLPWIQIPHKRGKIEKYITIRDFN